MQGLPRWGRLAAILMILSVFLVACGACAIPYFGDDAPGREPDQAPAIEPDASGAVQFGQVVTAGGIGQGNRPMDESSTFDMNAPIIYVVAEAERVEAGTTMFARWYRDGEPFEDTPVITADRDYTDTFVEFHIEPDQVQLEPGRYSVQIFANGNPGPTVDFTVR